MDTKELDNAADQYVGHKQEIDEPLISYIKRCAFLNGAEFGASNMLRKVLDYLRKHDSCIGFKSTEDWLDDLVKSVQD